MLLTRLGLLAALALSPAVAQVSNLPLALNDSNPVARRQFGPIQGKAEHQFGAADSANWSGYAVTGSSFTSVTGSWVVPSVLCMGKDQYSAFWVGLDGYNSDTVEQVGTLSDCEGSNPAYYAWYEFYPNVARQIKAVPVNPGDVITASVVYHGDRFIVTITDQTTGISASEAGPAAGAARSSAEWIAEAPCCTANGGILPMADYGTVMFGYDYTGQSSANYAASSSNNGSIGSFGAANIEQITKAPTQSSPQVSSCSVLSNDGTSFACAWVQ